MNIEKTLHVQKRAQSGKGHSGRLRAQNLIPGIFYTPDGTNIPVEAAALPLEKIIAEVGRTTVFNLEINDNNNKSTHPALIWQVQRHPYKIALTHIDFYGVDLNKEVKLDVPLVFTGTSRGVKLGGVLETYRESVRLAGKPMDMPKKILVDVTSMDINSSIAVKDLQLPSNIKPACDQNLVIVSVLTKSKEEGLDGTGQEAPAATAG
ncbi:MAG: 50S ribosomal protein L25/general stress protein Ctc [Desulfovibrio sp.]|jgi:large subunit ribosomal protein L25|nr:50S ribosomal protein L25/general stress protein Ctc [Desulfovibrio sp.]